MYSDWANPIDSHIRQVGLLARFVNEITTWWRLSDGCTGRKLQSGFTLVILTA